MIDPDALDWAKADGLVPAIVQDRQGQVRMLGYMNRSALVATLDSGFVTFFSRSKGRLWSKGECSGNRLRLRAISGDCDHDALLVTADADGPTCHTGKGSCFDDGAPFFPTGLETIIRQRTTADTERSYTAKLIADGPRRLAQKVGEEGVEVALAAVGESTTELVAEAADLVFHLTLLLQQRDLSWLDVHEELERRHRERSSTASS